MKKILVVDDNPDIVWLAQNLLEEHNYKVISAADGEAGFKKAKQEKPDLILMDIMMPNVSGGDAVKLLRADRVTKDIPVIFLTATVSNHPTIEEEKGINVDGEFIKALSKVFNSEKLFSEINKLIGDT